MLLGPGEVRAARGSHTAFALGTFLQCTLTAVASSCFPAPLLLFLCSVLIKDVLGTQLQTSRMFLQVPRQPSGIFPPPLGCSDDP